jgi:hypothetical protein
LYVSYEVKVNTTKYSCWSFLILQLSTLENLFTASLLHNRQPEHPQKGKIHHRYTEQKNARKLGLMLNWTQKITSNFTDEQEENFKILPQKKTSLEIKKENFSNTWKRKENRSYVNPKNRTRILKQNNKVLAIQYVQLGKRGQEISEGKL